MVVGAAPPAADNAATGAAAATGGGGRGQHEARALLSPLVRQQEACIQARLI